MRLLMQWGLDGEPELLEPSFAQDMHTLYMHLANGAADQTRFTADSEAALRLVRDLLADGYAPTPSPLALGVTESTFYRAGDETYSLPLRDALISLFPSETRCGDRIWVFVDPVPRSEYFPPIRWGLRRIGKRLFSMLQRVVGRYLAYAFVAILILYSFICLVFLAVRLLIEAIPG